MLYDSVMRNMQNRHKRIKHMNSFISARFQRKNLFKIHFQDPGLRSRVLGPGLHL